MTIDIRSIVAIDTYRRPVHISAGMETLHVGVTKSKLPGTAILRLAGPLTLATQFQLEDISARFPMPIFLDVFESPYIDSAGLGTILAHWSHTLSGGNFAITGVSKRIQMLLELTRVNTVLPVYRTPDEEQGSPHSRVEPAVGPAPQPAVARLFHQLESHHRNDRHHHQISDHALVCGHSPRWSKAKRVYHQSTGICRMYIE